MTLTIINHFTHNKTFSVYGKPNGTSIILEEAGYHLNPRVHSNLPPFFISDSRSDGSAEQPSSAQTSEVISTSRREHKDDFGVKGPSDNFEEGE